MEDGQERDDIDYNRLWGRDRGALLSSSLLFSPLLFSSLLFSPE
jgi:hypothetical protein